jgi:hypothetical protein
MDKLIEILTKETESLKNQYLEMTKEWAEKEFYYLRQWAIDYRNGKFGFDEASRKYYKLPSYIINGDGKVEYHIDNMLKLASEHYTDSLLKLADRIEKKGLNVETLKVKTSHIDVNIEIILTDGIKTIKAFTIIAGGSIQRPHYRYLIK